eukprot:GDKI01044569.1.p1 GENE.GDKI01044569.1~~GDKI01044569.1.p1  ORF type:complete len:194 (+),score=29.04 GDKI01044569.1:489-1070(+)
MPPSECSIVDCDDSFDIPEAYAENLKDTHTHEAVCVFSPGEGVGSTSAPLCVFDGKLAVFDNTSENFSHDSFTWKHVLQRNLHPTHYILHIQRPAAQLGFGGFILRLQHLARKGVDVKAIVALQVFGPHSENKTIDSDIKVYHKRIFDVGGTPMEYEAHLTDHQAFKLNGYTGNPLVSVLPEGFCLRYRCIIE